MTPTSEKKKAIKRTEIARKNDALIVFLKVPEKGKVKTRIGDVVGNEKAVDIYRKLLLKTMQTISHLSVQKLLFFAPKPFYLSEWPDQEVQEHLQQGGDLGERMHHSFEVALQEADRALVIGTDCPYLTPEVLSEAYEQLVHHDMVMGPSPDGGYYLLGMKTPCPEVFQDIPWSTDQVSTLTVERMKTLGKTWYEMPTLADIDFIEDWEAYLAASACC